MGPIQPNRSDSIVNNVINFFRAISSLDRRTQLIAIGIFAGLSTVIWSCYKKFSNKATKVTPNDGTSKLFHEDKIFKHENLMSVLSQDGEQSHALAAEIVGLPQNVLNKYYTSFKKEIEVAFSLHLNLLFSKIAESRNFRVIDNFLQKRLFAVTNEELPIRAEISDVWKKISVVWSSNNLNYDLRPKNSDTYQGLLEAYLYSTLKNQSLDDRNEEFLEAIRTDSKTGEANIFSWVCQSEEDVSKKAPHFSEPLLLLKDKNNLTVLHYFLECHIDCIGQLIPFDPQPHQLGNSDFLINTLKNDSELLEKFIFTESFLKTAMPIVLTLFEKKDQGTIVSVVKFLQLAKVIPIESGGYMKLVDRMNQSLDLLGTSEARKGLENLSACAKLITGTPDFLNPRQRALLQGMVKRKKETSDAQLLRDRFQTIQAVVNDLLSQYTDGDHAAEYSKIFGYYGDICYAVFGVAEVSEKEKEYDKIVEARIKFRSSDD